MTLTADPGMDPVATTDLLAQVRSQFAVREAADVRIVQLAAAWADAHPDLSDPAHTVEDDPDSPWCGLPVMAWDAAAPFATANRMSTTAGAALIRDALILRHRLPRIWARLVAGQVPAWRARRIAQALLGQPDDVATYLDQQIAERAEKVGLVVLDRIIDEAKLRLHAEERELEQLEALDARYVHLDERSLNHTGIADLQIRGDWADLAAFDDTVREVAAALDRDGCGESLDVRRSMAVGILADPARALTLLRGEAGRPQASRKRRIVLTVHLSEANLLGLDPVVIDADQRAHLDQLVRTWCARDDVTLTVQPVLDLDAALRDCDHDREAHDPTSAQLTAVQLRDRHCMFPFCTRPARSCDCDHRDPWDPDDPARGPTCPCNLTPLCRHHHRLKTHAGWRYTTLEPGHYLWADPHGQRFITSADGTTDVTGPP